MVAGLLGGWECILSVPFIQTAFASGEISPELWGHVDLAKFSVGASTLRNMVVSYRGGAFSRAGTAFVGQCKQAGTALPPRDIPFQFSVSQGYVLEFGSAYMRVKYRGAYVLEPPKTITGITNAFPAVVTSNAHGFSNGDWVFITGVNNMTQVNNRTFIVAGAAANTFQITDTFGNGIDSRLYNIYTSGGTAARYFTLATPYAAVDLPYLKYVQSADVMSLTCVNQDSGTEYPPYDLTRISAISWTLTAQTFNAAVAPPANATATATTVANPAGTPPTFATGYAYCVTAVHPITGEESIASNVANATNSVDIAATSGSLIVNWDAVAGANYTYNVYKAPPSFNTGAMTSNANPVPAGSLFGYVGTTYGTTFVDSNIVQDLSQVPPLHRNPFDRGQILSITITGIGAAIVGLGYSITTGTGAGFVGEAVVSGGTLDALIVRDPGHDYHPGDTITFTVSSGTPPTGTLNIGPQTGTYPGGVTYFQQRRVYFNTTVSPDTYFMSQPGRFKDFDARIPTIETDAIIGSPWSLQVNGIQWMIPMPGGLVTLTGKGAWQISGSGSSGFSPQPITPISQQAQPQAFNGVSPIVPPIPINYDILYVQAKGAIVRDLNYNFWANVYTGIDLTLLSGQLFENHTLVQWAYAEEPYKVVWAIRDDATLLSLTYLKEQEVYGWAHHDAAAAQYVSVCTVTEPPVDAIYLITRRFINNVGVYYSERMDNRLWQTQEEPWCVDCGIAYPLGSLNATITADNNSGTAVNSVQFTLSAALFGPGYIGQVVRMSQGVGVIDSVRTTQVALGHWTLPPPPSQILTQASGAWTITNPVSQVTGIDFLAGQKIVGLADGVPIGPFTVPTSPQGGTVLITINLPFPATNIKLGIPFIPQVQSVYLNQGQPTIQGRRKNISAVTVRAKASSGFQVGSNQPDGAAQTPPSLFEAWTNMATSSGQGATFTTPGGASGHLFFTGDVRVPIVSEWAKPGQAAVQQPVPLPLYVTALIPEVLEGDLPEAAAEKPERGQAARGPGTWMLKAAI